MHPLPERGGGANIKHNISHPNLFLPKTAVGTLFWNKIVEKKWERGKKAPENTYIATIGSNTSIRRNKYTSHSCKNHWLQTDMY